MARGRSKPFPRHMTPAYTIDNERFVYWANKNSVLDQAKYQRAFLLEHLRRFSLDEIRRMHRPHPKTLVNRALCVQFEDHLGVPHVRGPNNMHWIDTVLFVANPHDIDNMVAIMQCESMDVFNIPVHETPPFTHKNSLLQVENDHVRYFHQHTPNKHLEAEPPMNLVDIMNRTKGNICIACMAGSNRSTASLIAYQLLTADEDDDECSLDKLLSSFANVRKYRIFDYNMSQLVTINNLRVASRSGRRTRQHQREDRIAIRE